MKWIITAAFLCASAALIVPAQADESSPAPKLTGPADPAGDPMNPWFFRVGAAQLQFLNGFNLTVAGQPVPGAALHFNHIYSALLEVGYTFAPDWSAVLSVGWPPSFGVYGGGSLAPYGKLVSTTFGPSALTVQYKPLHEGFFRPYVGAGISYIDILSTHDGAVQNAKLSNDLAPEIEAGSDFMVQDNWGFFVEVKKAWLSTHATGTVGPYPASGKANIAPWVYATGVTMHL